MRSDQQSPPSGEGQAPREWSDDEVARAWAAVGAPGAMCPTAKLHAFLAELLPSAPVERDAETDREIHDETIAEVARDLQVANAPELQEAYGRWLAANGPVHGDLLRDVNAACYAIHRIVGLKTALRGAAASRERWRARAADAAAMPRDTGQALAIAHGIEEEAAAASPPAPVEGGGMRAPGDDTLERAQALVRYVGDGMGLPWSGISADTVALVFDMLGAAGQEPQEAGVEKRLTEITELCPRCDGSGDEPHTDNDVTGPATCRKCDGWRRVPRVLAPLPDEVPPAPEEGDGRAAWTDEDGEVYAPLTTRERAFCASMEALQRERRGAGGGPVSAHPELDPAIREAILRAGVMGLERGRAEAGERLAAAEEEADQAGRALDVVAEGLARLRVLVRDGHRDDVLPALDALRSVAVTRRVSPAPAPAETQEGGDLDVA